MTEYVPTIITGINAQGNKVFHKTIHLKLESLGDVVAKQQKEYPTVVRMVVDVAMHPVNSETV